MAIEHVECVNKIK